MSAPYRPEPDEFDLWLADRLGLDREQVLAGSLTVEYDLGTGNSDALVRWSGAAVLPAAEVLAKHREVRGSP